MTDKANPFYTWRSAISESDLPAAARHVALALSLYLNERTTTAFPGAVRLSRDTGLSERCVREHLGVLVKVGFLAVKEQGGLKGERRHATVYEIRTPAPALPMTESHPIRKQRVPLQEVPTTPAPVAAQLSIELSKELSNTLFDEFWSSYPKKQGKRAARKAWDSAVKRAYPREVLVGLERFCDHAAGMDSRYVPHPSTWLNGDRWEDVYVTPEEDAVARRLAEYRAEKGGRRGTG